LPIRVAGGRNVEQGQWNAYGSAEQGPNEGMAH
jgi:hypothetical protein